MLRIQPTVSLDVFSVKSILLFKEGGSQMSLKIPCKHGQEHQIYNPLEASIYMGISQEMLNKHRREGYIRSFSIGRGYLYTKEDLDDALMLLSKRNTDLYDPNEDRSSINVKYI